MRPGSRECAEPSGLVQTVLGPVPANQLGRVNYHEHFFQVSPLLVGDELTDEERSTAEAADVRSHGITTVVDATPIGLGRHPAALARLAQASGLTVIATTGVHRPPHYAPGHWIHQAGEAELTQLMDRDVSLGMPVSDPQHLEAHHLAPHHLAPHHPQTSEPPDPVCDSVPDLASGFTPVRAGVLKVGLGYWEIPPLARRALSAAATVHRDHGLPVMIHLEHCTAAHEVLDLLAELGVSADSVALAHVDRVPDTGLHAELAARGAYLGYDGAARLSAQPEAVLIDTLAALVERGHGDRVLLGGDVARATRYIAYGGMPGLRYLTQRFVPRVEERLGPLAVQALLEANPARWLNPVAEPGG